MIQEMVDALPKAEDGEPGKDADPALIERMVNEAVAKVPAAAPGKDADPAVIKQTVDEAVSKLPPAKDGEPGREGPPGKLPVVKEWTDRVYYEGEVATIEGSTYQALKDTGRHPSHDDWICIARAGRDGNDGKSLKVASTYDPEKKDYRELEIVALNGGSFVARKDDPGPCPGAGWQLIASQGKRGNPGEPGPRVKGDPGPPGSPIVSADVDNEGMLTLTNGDGSEVRCDLYPLLSKLAR
jgi:hypothetical protein